MSELKNLIKRNQDFSQNSEGEKSENSNKFVKHFPDSNMFSQICLALTVFHCPGKIMFTMLETSEGNISF